MSSVQHPEPRARAAMVVKGVGREWKAKGEGGRGSEDCRGERGD